MRNERELLRYTSHPSMYPASVVRSGGCAERGHWTLVSRPFCALSLLSSAMGRFLGEGVDSDVWRWRRRDGSAIGICFLDWKSSAPGLERPRVPAVPGCRGMVCVGAAQGPRVTLSRSWSGGEIGNVPPRLAGTLVYIGRTSESSLKDGGLPYHC